MQITNPINKSYTLNFSSNHANQREQKNQIPKRIALSAGIFATLNVAQQLIIKNSKKMQSWSSTELVAEITKKGFSKSHLGKDVALGALLGLFLGYFENKENKK